MPGQPGRACLRRRGKKAGKGAVGGFYFAPAMEDWVPRRAASTETGEPAVLLPFFQLTNRWPGAVARRYFVVRFQAVRQRVVTGSNPARAASVTVGKHSPSACCPCLTQYAAAVSGAVVSVTSFVE